MPSKKGYDWQEDSKNEGVEKTSTTRSSGGGDIAINSYRETGGGVNNIHFTEEVYSDGSVRNEHYTAYPEGKKHSFGVKQINQAVQTSNFLGKETVENTKPTAFQKFQQRVEEKHQQQKDEMVDDVLEGMGCAPVIIFMIGVASSIPLASIAIILFLVN